jgi:site-specific DNA-methyltransferase (adenine-specific)
VYDFVPVQDFTEPWSDEKLYKKYGITKDEIAFIESMIRPMELDNE